MLVQKVVASWTSHVPEASTYSDLVEIEYMSQPPYEQSPIQAYVPNTFALSDVKAYLLAGDLGGTVRKAPPPKSNFYDVWALNPSTGLQDGWQPSVNWIDAPINGISMTVNGGLLIASFNVEVSPSSPNAAEVLKSAVLATFSPVS